MNPRHAQTSAPILDPLKARWSPRAFDADHTFPHDALRSIFEAARWSPSASNTQPWRYIIARRGSTSFAKITDALLGFNQAWAGNAAALIVAIAEVQDAEGNELRWAEYDLGQSVAHLSVQAHAEGYYVHQMGGFKEDELRASFGLTEHQVPISVSALGRIGDPQQLPEPLKERESAPRERLSFDDIVLLND